MMNKCLCCRDRLLKHLSQNRIYWFCPTCYQQMPNIKKSAFCPRRKSKLGLK